MAPIPFDRPLKESPPIINPKAPLKAKRSNAGVRSIGFARLSREKGVRWQTAETRGCASGEGSGRVEHLRRIIGRKERLIAVVDEMDRCSAGQVQNTNEHAPVGHAVS